MFATVIALPLKVIYCNYAADKIILKRPPWNTIKILIGNYAFFAAVVFGSRFFSLNVTNYGIFILYGIIIVSAFGIVCFGVNIWVNPDIIKMILRVISKKNKKQVQN